MLNPILLQISKFFYGLCWSRTTSVCQLESASLIFFSLAMVGFGLLGIIHGRVKISHFSLKGMTVRLLGAFLLLGVACAFIPKYGVLIEIVLALVIVVIGLLLSEKPVQSKPLPAGTHTFQSGPDEPAYRLHLRLLKDGSGILILNAATVLHLNATAAEFAYHMIKGSSPEATARQVARRYRINREEAQKDYMDFRDRLQTLIHTPDLDPTTFLDFERIAPHSHDLTAPLRLDCALTYRLSAGADASLAPTKRVDRELTTEEWQTIMDKAWAVGIPHITFTGGEPTLREDLPALIAHAEKIGQVTGLLSDGLKLADKAYLYTLLRTGLDHLLFILDPENDASWKALETVMLEDLFTTVHFTVTPKNVKKADEVLEKLAKLEVKSLSLTASDASLKDGMQKLREQAAGLGLTLHWDLPVPYSTDNPVAAEVVDDEVPDGAGKVWLYVEPDGDVLPAQGEADKILGNFLRDPWEKIYH
ncbi:MAG: radical SAM protein [Candidatus Atribacteria bacterium]|nr:radical SAM protein [Candidatus Atribacteria bacterium]